jgi:hypothetical protein
MVETNRDALILILIPLAFYLATIPVIDMDFDTRVITTTNFPRS